MSSSESTDSSNYSIINENNMTLSTNLEIVETNKNNNEKPLMELSHMIVPINENISKNQENNINNSLPIKEIPKQIEQPQQAFVTNLLFGNPEDSLNPKYLGRSLGFLYDLKGDPKITIGPDCKSIINELIFCLIRFV